MDIQVELILARKRNEEPDRLTAPLAGNGLKVSDRRQGRAPCLAPSVFPETFLAEDGASERKNAEGRMKSPRLALEDLLMSLMLNIVFRFL